MAWAKLWATCMDAGITLVIPAYNEETRLPATLERLIPTLSAQHCPFEIIVVSDGIGDRTSEVALRYSASRVRLLRFDTKQGKGGAVKAGFLMARYSLVGFLDADTPLAARDLDAMLGFLRDYDVVIASRWTAAGKPHFHSARLRNLLSLIWSSLVRACLVTNVRDTQCGAKFFRASRLAPLLSKVDIRGWAFDISLLGHCERSGLSINEVEVSWPDNAGSQMRLLRDVPVMLATLVLFRLENSPFSRLVTHPSRLLLRARLGALAAAVEKGTTPPSECGPQPAVGVAQLRGIEP